MRDIVCIGGSAGGIEALVLILASLPADLPASLFVVIHIPPFQVSGLSEILDRAGPLHATLAKDGERFAKGWVYVAPPDHHILLENGKIRVLKGPKENRFRPAIDPLFRSAAQYYPTRSIGILLSGLLDDGTAGLWALQRAGGVSLLQNLEDARFPDMPRSAAEYIHVDHWATSRSMGQLLTRLVRQRSKRDKPAPVVEKITRIENDYARLQIVSRTKLEEIGKPSSLICPDCNGPLWQMKKGPRRFRCHTGHSFTPQALLTEHRALTERTLSVLMTLFDDEVRLTRHVVETTSSGSTSQQVKRDLHESEKRARALRTLLAGGYQQQKLPETRAPVYRSSR